MSTMHVGVVTFGQRGATGVTGDLQMRVPGVTFEEVGLLDGVPPQRLREWVTDPNSTEATIVRGDGGGELSLQPAPLLARLPAAIDALAAGRPDAIVFGCAGPLPELAVPCLSVNPFALLRAFVDAVLPAGRVAIIVPSPLHVAPTQARYASATRAVACRSASPHDLDAVTQALAAGAAEGATLGVLACFDHTEEDLAAARRAAAVPVVSSRALSATALAALFAGPIEESGALRQA